MSTEESSGCQIMIEDSKETEATVNSTTKDVGDSKEDSMDSEKKSNQESQSSQETETKRESPTLEGGDSIQEETVEFKVVYNKQKYDIIFPLNDTVSSLKSHIENLISVPSSMQKVMFKGRMKDDMTLREHKVTKGSKIMVVGSTVHEVMSVAAPDPKAMKEEEKAAAAAQKEPLSKQKPHKTILEKHGKPEDAMPGIKNQKESLPHVPVSGMYNKSGSKVRLTFKLESDQLWIGTKERTDKIPMGSIKAVVNEPIDGHEDYHMMGIQLGPTEASRYWIYWVPAQYVDAIKDAVLGKWQYF